jgi:hypothetical protein
MPPAIIKLESSGTVGSYAFSPSCNFSMKHADQLA